MRCVGGPMHGEDYPLSEGAESLMIPLWSSRHPKQEKADGLILRGMYRRTRLHSAERGDYEVLRFVEGYYDPLEAE